VEISSHSSVLALGRNPSTGRRTLRLFSDLAQVLPVWDGATRVSPVFPIRVERRSAPNKHDFDGEHEVFLIGPVAPTTLASAFGATSDAWLSLGSYNLVVRTDPGSARTFESILRKRASRYERWRIRDGEVVSAATPIRRPSGKSWRHQLTRLARLTVPPELHHGIVEYCPLMAAAISRSEQVMPAAAADLLLASRLVDELVRNKRVGSYEKLGLLTTINAGLARFTSQTFAGSSPVMETECHLWSHSLLGTGLANQALIHIRQFVDRTLGAARIPSRLELLATQKSIVPTLDVLSTADYWFRDHIGSIVPAEEGDPLFPLITFFSGRDGFKSTLHTLSAPLAVLPACNSYRWTLLTLTHEISHDVVRGALVVLFPDRVTGPYSLLDAQLLLNQQKRSNLLDEVRHFLLVSILAIDEAENDTDFARKPQDYLGDLEGAVEAWRSEVEELMAHVLDFLYFYGKDPDRYVRGIWMSWSVIPNLSSRIPEYVLRTLCALLVLHLRRGRDAEQTAKDQFVAILTDLKSTDHNGAYITEALKYVKDNWNDDLITKLAVRKPIVKIVQGFLYSDTIATALRSDVSVTGGVSADREGYPHRIRNLTNPPIHNPLRFLEVYTNTLTPSEALSAWILYAIAFAAETP
jgi:hypothetical protein